MMRDRLYMGMSISRKVNLGNYESADVHLSMNGITVETTEAEMDAMLNEQGALAFSKMKEKLKEKVKELTFL